MTTPVSVVSVIIPNYNCGRWLSKTIDSCLAQREYVKEIIIIDDFSTDNSWGLLKEYRDTNPDVIRVYKNEKKGGNHARNFGFSKSTGAFIQWLDADDQIIGDKLGSQLTYFDEHPQVDIVYSDWQLNTYDASGSLAKSEFKTNAESADFLYALLVDEWSAPHVYLMKRKIAELTYEQLAWNPETPVYQDREYFTVAALAGARFGYVKGNFAVYNRWNKASVSAAKVEIRNESLEKILKRFEDLLHEQEWISSVQRKRYQAIISTQRLLVRSLNFNTHFASIAVNFNEIQWQLIRGVRTKLRVLMMYIKLKLKPT